MKKVISIVTSLALLANGVQPIHAANLVAIPQNVQLPTPPTYIQTRSSELSFKSFETNIKNVLKPEKTQPKVADTDKSGSCGTSVTYTFTAADEKLIISGSGDMTNYSSYSDVPWEPYMDSIKTVVIENGVTSISQFAFYVCAGLTSVTIPDSVTYIGYCAFDGCTRLNSVTIPDSVTSIGQYAFSDCTGLTSVTIPDSVTIIGDFAFYGCTGLTSVTIPDSVTTIGDYAFSGCTGLTSVTIPDSVTSIGNSAFSCCTGLTSVTYYGTSDPGPGWGSAFWTTDVACANVPWNYKDSTFCGISISRPPAPTPSMSPLPTSTPTPSMSPLPTSTPTPSMSPLPTSTPSPSMSPLPTSTPNPENSDDGSSNTALIASTVSIAGALVIAGITAALCYFKNPSSFPCFRNNDIEA